MECQGLKGSFVEVDLIFILYVFIMKQSNKIYSMGSMKKIFKKISTQLLTALIISVIVYI